MCHRTVEHVIRYDPFTTIGELKRQCGQLFGLEIGSVKLVGVPPKTLDSKALVELNLKPKHRIGVSGIPQRRIGVSGIPKRENVVETIPTTLEPHRKVDEELGSESEESCAETEFESKDTAPTGFFSSSGPRVVENSLEKLSFSAKVVCNPEILPSRAVLPKDFLEPLLDFGASSPMIFEITFSSHSHVVSVESFEAAPGTIQLSHAGCIELRATENNNVTVSLLKDIPRASFASFTPLREEWFDIPEEERLALLEFELRKLLFLRQNSVLRMQYLANEFDFRVSKLEPAQISLIVNTELTTEVTSPDILRKVPVDILDEGKSIPFDLNEGTSFRFFDFEVKDVSLTYIVSCEFLIGDGVLFGSFSDVFPNTIAFQFCSDERAQESELCLSSSDLLFQPGRFRCFIEPISLPCQGLIKLSSGVRKKSLLDASIDSSLALRQCSNW